MVAMGMLFNILGLVTIILAITTAILCTVGGQGVRDIKLEDFFTYVGDTAVNSRALTTALQTPGSGSAVSIGDVFMQTPGSAAVASWASDNTLIHDINCFDIQTRYITNTSFEACRGTWQAADESLDKNAYQYKGFTKPNLKKTKTCDSADSAYAYNPEDISLTDTESSEKILDKYFGQKYYRKDERSQQELVRLCLKDKRISNFSIFIVVGTCVTISVTIVALIVAGTATSRGPAMRSCFSRGPAMLFALAVLSVSSCTFFTSNHMVYLRRSKLAVRSCVENSTNSGIPATPKEFYYNKLPVEECFLNRDKSQCSVVPLNTADRLEEAEKETVVCQSGYGGVSIEFIHGATQKKDCKSATAKCLDTTKATSPASATVLVLEEKKVLWCAECTSGPEWTLDSSAQQVTLGPVNPITQEPEWTGYVNAMSSSTADQNHPCVWVGEPLPIIKQKGYGENKAAKAGSCINRFEEIDSHACEKASYQQFLFDYGHPNKCSTPEGRKSFQVRNMIGYIETVGTLGADMYPDCVMPNFEKCYVMRGGSPEIRKKIKPADSTVSPFQNRGGDNTGDNNCVLQQEDETACKCKCTDGDYVSGNCEMTPLEPAGESDGVGKMTDKHPLFEMCKSAICSSKQEIKKCQFLDSTSKDDSMARYFAENGICAGRQTTEPDGKNYCQHSSLALYCGINAQGDCISKAVECNEEQKQKIGERKEIYLRSLVPKVCLSNQADEYRDEKATKQFLDHAGLIMGGIVTLSVTGFFAFLLALLMQMTSGNDASKKNGSQEDNEKNAIVDPVEWIEKQKQAKTLMELQSRNIGSPTTTTAKFDEFASYHDDDDDFVGGVSSRKTPYNPTQVVPVAPQKITTGEQERKIQYLREQALQKIETVRSMLARRLKDDKKFLRTLNKIDKDENGSINGKEFAKLLVKVKKRDHHHSDGWTLTGRTAGMTWAAALRDEALHKGVSGDTNLDSKELTFAGMRRWIFPVPLTASSVKEWRVEA